jgi:glucokinase
MSKYLVGVDIGGQTTKMAICTKSGALIEKFSIVTDIFDAGIRIIPNAAKAIEAKLEELSLAIQDIQGVGVGIPGPVDEQGVVQVGVNIGWSKPMPVKRMLSEILRVPVIVTNDANIAALGEMWLGAAKGTKNAVMYTLGTGVGGAVIVNGRIVNGANGAAGEIGHIVVMPEGGAICGCGKTGCLETFVSAKGIVRMTKEKLKENAPQTALNNIEEIRAKDVFDCARDGDEFALMIVDMVGYYLGLSAANMAVTIDPEKFIFGGGVAYAGDILLDAIRMHYAKYAFGTTKNTSFVFARLGNDAGVIGGAYLASGLGIRR